MLEKFNIFNLKDIKSKILYLFQMEIRLDSRGKCTISTRKPKDNNAESSFKRGISAHNAETAINMNDLPCDIASDAICGKISNSFADFIYGCELMCWGDFGSFSQ